MIKVKQTKEYMLKKVLFDYFFSLSFAKIVSNRKKGKKNILCVEKIQSCIRNYEPNILTYIENLHNCAKEKKKKIRILHFVGFFLYVSLFLSQKKD